MQVPSILLGKSRTRLLQGIAIGAIASMVIGFSWGGWVLGSTANRLAAEQANTAVVAVLTPICVEKFLQNGDAQGNLAALREISSNWQQGQYLRRAVGRHGQALRRPTTSCQGVCSEIGRSQSCIPISSIALRDTVNIGNMALANDIDLIPL